MFVSSLFQAPVSTMPHPKHTSGQMNGHFVSTPCFRSSSHWNASLYSIGLIGSAVRPSLPAHLRHSTIILWAYLKVSCIQPALVTSNHYLRTTTLGWRDGSVVKSIGWSSRVPVFKSQQPHGDSQRSDGIWCPPLHADKQEDRALIYINK